MKICMKT